MWSQLPHPVGVRALPYDQLAASPTMPPCPTFPVERRAMILYTSGTTSRPKGVVTTHANIAAQIKSLVDAWEWSATDRILLCLPLHHVHGIINVVCCALWSGATCHMLPRFDANAVWDCIAGGGLTLFMAVPTVYAKLIAAWDAASPERRAELSAACSRLRLMVSGSAALPVSTLQRWKEISGHTLLERYGMTEIGMALSNPLHGERVPGSVGTPLPGVEVRLVEAHGKPAAPGTPGEIEVRGPAVFAEYWAKPDATREAFRDGWFRTGDTAVVENGIYRILGRTNIDILKTGGHKVSALEIEEALRQHPAVAECAVVGVPDPEWGERVAAAVVLHEGHALDLHVPSHLGQGVADRSQAAFPPSGAGCAAPQRHGKGNEACPGGAVSKPDLKFSHAMPCLSNDRFACHRKIYRAGDEALGSGPHGAVNCILSLSRAGCTLTLGRRATSTNWPPPSADSSMTPTASSTYASTTTPASAQRCRYQSLWQAEREATRSSSGFQRARSPRNAGSDEPAMVGFPATEIS